MEAIGRGRDRIPPSPPALVRLSSISTYRSSSFIRSHHARSFDAPEVHIRCIFEGSHRSDRIGISGFDVTVLGDRHRRVAKYALNGLVRHAKPVQVSG